MQFHTMGAVCREHNIVKGDQMRVVRIGLLGLGTVGQAVVQLNRPIDGIEFQIVRALVRNIHAPRSVPTPCTQDPGALLNDPTLDVIVDVTGGREPARSWILTALESGKTVITANKEVIAYHGPELIRASQAHQAYFGFEASVGGGIPILDALHYHLANTPVHEIYGVLNGTSNYLLCAMAAGQSLPEALQEAQKAGYAEADPTADVQGYDAVRKLVILAYLAFDGWLNPDDINVEGLRDWPYDLFSRLQRAGLGLRLLAVARKNHSGLITAQVRPTVVPNTSRLMRLIGAQNGMGISTEAGHFWIEGPGAGGTATATSIWSDIRRSQRCAGDWMPHDAPAIAAVKVELPLIEIAVDPDRRLSTDASTPHPFVDPSLRLLPAASEPNDGTWSFPLWTDETQN